MHQKYLIPKNSDSFKLGRFGVAAERYKGNWVVKGGFRDIM